jgi:hypothetical protein
VQIHHQILIHEKLLVHADYSTGIRQSGN